MKYILMHQDYPVFEVLLDEAFRIKKITDNFNEDRIPLIINKNNIEKYILNNWLFDRGIPEKRKELKAILSAHKMRSKEELIVKNLGLSLIDHYWLKTEKDTRTWKDVNYHDNHFNQEGNELYTGGSAKIKSEYKYIDINKKPNPNNVSSGMLPKRWIKENNKMYLLKGTELSTHQEPFNEKIISDYLELLNVDHVSYDLHWQNDIPYSKCEYMLKPNEELIHSYCFLHGIQKNNNTSYYEHYINGGVSLGLDRNMFKKELEYMIMIDYITANTDRHWSNFGIIRDADTLKAIRPAPIYDNGTALYAKYPTGLINKNIDRLKNQSFRNKHDTNIKLVKDFSLLQNENIKTILEILKTGYDEGFVEISRQNVIQNATKQRLNNIFNYAKIGRAHV